MSESKKTKKLKSLSEQLADLVSPTPKKEWDPEDAFGFDTARAVLEDAYEDETEQVAPQRGKGKKLSMKGDITGLDEKYYSGKKATRKELFGDIPKKKKKQEIEEEDEEEEDDEDNEDEYDFGDEDQFRDDDGGSDEEDQDGDQSEDEEEEEENQKKKKNKSKKNVDLEKKLQELEVQEQEMKIREEDQEEEEKEKALNVKSQQTLIDSFLDLRIRLQHSLDIANTFPQKETMKPFIKSDEIQNQIDSTLNSVLTAFNTMSQIKNQLLERNSETNQFLVKFEITNDAEKTWKGLSNSQSKLYQYADPVLEKWNQRTKITNTQLKVLNQSVQTQIQTILSDKERLIQRTQLKRKASVALGKSSQGTETHDVEIFDDSDFYAQQLRDLVESGIGGTEGDTMDSAVFAKKLTQAQKQLIKKRRKVDTKASKGRKLSYAVQPKLQNFMFPEKVEIPVIAEDLINNLFQS